jgi:hypothetical protein
MTNLLLQFVKSLSQIVNYLLIFVDQHLKHWHYFSSTVQQHNHKELSISHNHTQQPLYKQFLLQQLI